MNHNWLTINSIIINTIKSEAIFLHLPHRSKTFTKLQSVNINGELIKLSIHVTYLDVIFDSTFSFHRQLSHITKVLQYQYTQYALFVIQYQYTPLLLYYIITTSYFYPDTEKCILYNTP